MDMAQFKQGFRRNQWPPFFRLTEPLKCIKVDFDYAKTRKALDPNWDGYSIPDGHDIMDDDADLTIANLVTSQHKDNPHKHRIMLDLDYGASLLTLAGTTRLRLSCRPSVFGIVNLEEEIRKALLDCGITQPNAASPPKLHLLEGGAGMLEADIHHDFAFHGSSTQGHYHLIIGHDVPWPQYKGLLQTLARAGAIQNGYAKASIKRGYAALRPPWVHK